MLHVDFICIKPELVSIVNS